MTFTKQSRCLPTKETTELSSPLCGKLSKTEKAEIIDDLNSLYDSLYALKLDLNKLDLLIQKKFPGQNKGTNAGIETGSNGQPYGKA